MLAEAGQLLAALGHHSFGAYAARTTQSLFTVHVGRARRKATSSDVVFCATCCQPCNIACQHAKHCINICACTSAASTIRFSSAPPHQACLTLLSAAEGLEDVLQAQLQTYAGLEEIESIASTCSRSMNSRGESETSHGPYLPRMSMSQRSTPGDSAHSSPGGNSITGMLCMLACAARSSACAASAPQVALA